MTYQQNTAREIRILADVIGERIRQERIAREKQREGIDWRSCADPDIPGGDPVRLTVLLEEVGEVARAILERDYVPKHLVGQIDAIGDDELRVELVQVAAVAVAWIEAIDERGQS